MSTTAEAQTFLADPNNEPLVLEALKAKGFVVLPQADYQTEKDSIFRQNATQIESALSEAAKTLGIERPANTPVSTWAKTFADAAVQKLTTQTPPTPPAPKTEELKGDPLLIAQIKELSTKYSTLESKFTQKEEQANRKIIESSVVGDLVGAKLGDSPEVQKAKLNDLSSLIKVHYSPKVNENGEIVYHGPDGLPLVHADGRLKTALDITKEKFSYMLMPEAPKVEGLGLNGGVTAMADHVIADNLDAINAAARAKGFTLNSADYIKFTDKSIVESQKKYSNFKI